MARPESLTTALGPAPVSADDESLILVDEEDREVGSATKRRCHDGPGLLHRAFSVFLFRPDGRVILQQRSAGKRLWPGYWSNACCSHPRLGEETPAAAHRRLRQELGTDTALHHVYKFRYHATYGSEGSEHELCWVFVGRTDRELEAHPEEVSAFREITPEDLDRAVAAAPETFTPWFLLEWRALRGEHRDRISRILRDGEAEPASDPSPAFSPLTP